MNSSDRKDKAEGDPPWANAGAMFRDQIAQRGDSPLFHYRQNGGWTQMSWRQFGLDVEAMGLEALSRGLVPGDAIAILASTRPEWLVADVGAVAAGLISTGIYPTEPPKKVSYVINDCKARIAFVDSAEQVAKIQAIRAECPSLEIVVVMDGDAIPPLNPGFIGLDVWLASGRAHATSSPSAWREAGAKIRPEDTAILIYTSGTTGPPKGAMIPHRSIVYQAARTPAVFRMQEGWLRPAFLPLCHVAERMFCYLSMVSGMICAFVDGPVALIAALPDLRPDILVAVPRVYEKLHAAAQDWIASQPPERREMIRAAQSKAIGAGSPDGLAPDERGLVREMLAAIGLDRAQVLILGGARLSSDVFHWQASVGARVREIYGMTECGSVAVNFDEFAQPGVVGRPCSHGEVRLADTGEILVRGPHVFSGYLNLPEKTADVLRDGWYHTGDMGRFDPDGQLVLIDRLKDLIISSSGKNISPMEVERVLKSSPYIADAIAIGEGRNFLSALIILNPLTVAQALAERGEYCANFTLLASSPTTRALVTQAIEEANTNLSRPESVRAFRIIPRELNAADDLFTPTLKIKRRALATRFADLIEEMYKRNQDVPVNATRAP
jgi:long-chain acyl-CoA synthetase